MSLVMNDWLGQMYPDYILLIDALLCCIYAGSEHDLLRSST